MERNRHRLLALIAANRDRPKRREIENASGSEATVYLYDSIDSYYGVNAEAFVKDFNAITAPTIHLRINSPGGDVFDARSIATAISQHDSKVVAHVDGLAASAASYIAIAADEVEMAPGSFLMIHKAWTFAYGNSEDLLATAALLEKIDGSLAADYAKKTGKSSAQIDEWMSAETWFTAEEAVAEGFAGKVSEEDPEGVDNAWDLSVFANAPAPKIKPTGAPEAELAAAKVRADAAAAEDQANMEHAERLRRFKLDFA
ncbi:MAG TPA: head maturation protease, ClpP-related [Bradyrhizobium sp.]|jgi:ATP-dependent Clp protease protease subunit